MNGRQIYILGLVIYLNVYLWFIRNPFLSEYVSVALAVALPVLGIATFILSDKLFPVENDDFGEPSRPWYSRMAAVTGLLMMAIWGQLMFGLMPFLPSWFSR
jgi:hypothetical protein